MQVRLPLLGGDGTDAMDVDGESGDEADGGGAGPSDPAAALRFDFSGLKRQYMATESARERERLDAEFKANIEEVSQSLMRVAPNLKVDTVGLWGFGLCSSEVSLLLVWLAVIRTVQEGMWREGWVGFCGSCRAHLRGAEWTGFGVCHWRRCLFGTGIMYAKVHIVVLSNIGARKQA